MTYRPDLSDRLLQAAEELARTRSFADVTVAAAADLCKADVGAARAVFPDDQALRDALAAFYHGANRDVLAFAMRDVETVEDFIRQAQQAVGHYYDVFHQDPAMRDVWTEILTHRHMRETNVGHVSKNAGALLGVVRGLLPNIDPMTLEATIELMIHMTDVAARWAAARDPVKGRAMLDAFCRMIALTAEDLDRENKARAPAPGD
ncbi:hypothetical protein L2U69_04645 [Zavarzinia compransoris]|uniref:hypothetical protein n=1 Tax=Zavarzinia marina TaxID=2911065 RepID=UPI001F3BE026|nr:hypothetical protein [Zavarzinia marina]MCF4164925.1 hypothetical protein [Zavarzinia marina]